jgi:hypothetical protein
MKFNIFSLYIIGILVSYSTKQLAAQQTPYRDPIESRLDTVMGIVYVQPDYYELPYIGKLKSEYAIHFPLIKWWPRDTTHSYEDLILIKMRGQLKDSLPDKKNHAYYFFLANAYSRINDTIALKMYRTIIASRGEFYLHMNEFPEVEKTRFIRETYYKSFACVEAAQIYLRRGDPVNAMKFIDIAERDYPIRYKGGWPMAQIDDQYLYYCKMHCHYLFEEYDSVINYYLPKGIMNYPGIVILSLRKKYSTEQIQVALEEAIATLEFTPATEKEWFEITDYQTKQTKTYYYQGGLIEIYLFGIRIPQKIPFLGDRRYKNVIFDRETAIAHFKSCSFYQELTAP